MPLPARLTRPISDPFDMLHREFDSMLARMFGGGESDNGGRTWAPYAVDVREDADHFYVDAELPGFRKEDIELTLENQTLTIRAERKDEEEKKDHDYLLNERRYRRFLRSFTLPPTVDDRQVDAKLADGVLHVTLNKREETKPRKITVQ